MTMNTCMKNLQLIRNTLLALMFMIQPGIMALVVTEYSKMIHAHLLPVISSNKLVPPADDNLTTQLLTLFSSQTGRTRLHPC